jgi:hypothetical protein
MRNKAKRLIKLKTTWTDGGQFFNSNRLWMTFRCFNGYFVSKSIKSSFQIVHSSEPGCIRSPILYNKFWLPLSNSIMKYFRPIWSYFDGCGYHLIRDICHVCLCFHLRIELCKLRRCEWLSNSIYFVTVVIHYLFNYVSSSTTSDYSYNIVVCLWYGRLFF